MLFAWLLAAWGLLLPAGALAQANPFRDVPADHWSRRAIQELAVEGLVEGFPDGTFKGKKVVTRYDMAIHLAKMLARLDRVRLEGRPGISPEDAVTVTRLTNEYKQELDLLGIKVDALEARIGAVERTTERLDRDLSNVRVVGFYRMDVAYVDEPFDLTNYPFDRGNYPYDGLDESGLYPVRQEVQLRFLGNPYGLDGLNRDVEAFLELKGVLSGVASDRLQYRFSDPPIAGDDLDDFATSVLDERRVSVNKAHMKIRSKRLTLRIFSEEGITDFDGPAKLLTADGLAAAVFGDFSPEQGVEANGVYKKFTYRGSVLKDFKTSSSAGNNVHDLSDEFRPESVTDQDVYALRLAYETHRLDEDPVNRLIFGSSYVEHVQGYEEEHDFNGAWAADVVWEHRSAHEVDASLVHLATEGPGDQMDHGTMADLTWDKGRWKLIGKYYRFGYDYRANLAKIPWVDAGSSMNYNFRHPGGFTTRTRGERLLRSQIQYRADDTLFRSIEDLVLQGLYEEKWWEERPGDDPDYEGNRARRVYLQAIADLTDRTHVEYRTEYRKDVLVDEKGEYIHTLNLDMRLWGESSVVGDLELIDDYDSISEEDGDHFQKRRGQISVNSQVNDELFVKGYVETVKNEDRGALRSYSDADGLDINRIGGEFVYSLEDDFAAKLHAEREEVRDLRDPWADGVFDRFALEMNYNFTRAFKLRYVRGIQDLDYIRHYVFENDRDDFLINNFGQLSYRPTEATEVLLTYGFEYESGGWPSDRGPLVFDRTNKILQLTAQTDF